VVVEAVVIGGVTVDSTLLPSTEDGPSVVFVVVDPYSIGDCVVVDVNAIARGARGKGSSGVPPPTATVVAT